MLLEMKQPAQALTEFQATLKKEPIDSAPFTAQPEPRARRRPRGGRTTTASS